MPGIDRNNREVELVNPSTSQAARKKRASKAPIRLLANTGERNLEALSAAMKEWLVPVLVKAFMTEMRIADTGKIINCDLPTTEMHCKGSLDLAAKYGGGRHWLKYIRFMFAIMMRAVNQALPQSQCKKSDCH